MLSFRIMCSKKHCHVDYSIYQVIFQPEGWELVHIHPLCVCALVLLGLHWLHYTVPTQVWSDNTCALFILMLVFVSVPDFFFLCDFISQVELSYFSEPKLKGSGRGFLFWTLYYEIISVQIKKNNYRPITKNNSIKPVCIKCYSSQRC